jgi:hypothetical protein
VQKHTIRLEKCHPVDKKDESKRWTFEVEAVTREGGRPLTRKVGGVEWETHLHSNTNSPMIFADVITREK